MFVINHKKIFIILSLILVLASLVIIGVKGLNMGIEFKGGTVLEVSYTTVPELGLIKSTTEESLGFPAQVQYFGDNAVIIRTAELTEELRAGLINDLEALSAEGFTVERFNSVGPSIGKELRSKAIVSLLVVLGAIILFVAYAFRRVSRPISSWRYGLLAVVALLHDIIISAGLYALLGLEVDTLFVVGLLSILGLSVNDTIVVFDRIRENLRKNEEDTVLEEFSETIGKSLQQTIARSINTSLTLVAVLLSLWFFGPESTKNLALIMIVGTIIGTYSSIFLASPLLVQMVQKKNES